MGKMECECSLGIGEFCRECTICQNKGELRPAIALAWKLISERICEAPDCQFNFHVRQASMEEASLFCQSQHLRVQAEHEETFRNSQLEVMGGD